VLVQHHWRNVGGRSPDQFRSVSTIRRTSVYLTVIFTREERSPSMTRVPDAVTQNDPLVSQHDGDVIGHGIGGDSEPLHNLFDREPSEARGKFDLRAGGLERVQPLRDGSNIHMGREDEAAAREDRGDVSLRALHVV